MHRRRRRSIKRGVVAAVEGGLGETNQNIKYKKNVREKRGKNESCIVSGGFGTGISRKVI